MTKKEIFIALLAALILAIFISPFASNFPDGLERVAEDKDFIEKAEDSPLPKKFADYTCPFVQNPKMQTALAGFIGTLIVFFIAGGLARWINSKNS